MTTADALKECRELLKECEANPEWQCMPISVEHFKALMYGIEKYMAQAGSLAAGYSKLLDQAEPTEGEQR